MRKMKGTVPQRQAWTTHRLARDPGRQSDQNSGGGLAPAHPGWRGEREIIVSAVRRLSPWVVAILAAAPLAPACGQNLDAGKPASQIFAEVCANCHRSARELRSNAGASFLREHYTTGPDMASTMAAYLASAGSDSRVGAPQPKRPAAAAPAATARDAPAVDPARDPRHVQQTADPKALPVPPASAKGRPASGTAEAKPVASAPPAPARPVLEEFEE
jgi:hypothetical protein